MKTITGQRVWLPRSRQAEDLAVLLLAHHPSQRRIEQRRSLAHHCAQGLRHGEHLTHGRHSPHQYLSGSEALFQQGDQRTLLPNPAL